MRYILDYTLTEYNVIITVTDRLDVDKDKKQFWDVVSGNLATSDADGSLRTK